MQWTTMRGANFALFWGGFVIVNVGLAVTLTGGADRDAQVAGLVVSLAGLTGMCVAVWRRLRGG